MFDRHLNRYFSVSVFYHENTNKRCVTVYRGERTRDYDKISRASIRRIADLMYDAAATGLGTVTPNLSTYGTIGWTACGHPG